MAGAVVRELVAVVRELVRAISARGYRGARPPMSRPCRVLAPCSRTGSKPRPSSAAALELVRSRRIGAVARALALVREALAMHHAGRCPCPD